ncbi:type I-E CRISPR-associated protein Cas6/Cse3/CasE [Streptomyces aidingensis]|uniref:CRISPR-associated protein Cas6/Cse3/CasE, subtype I-E/ECOLI n=1 Tax=Streptomyces aidingensis TaxID=910347 RepID=A0A1I1V9R6_9ACTN|nr:type I-E CRISPR-associated protein Cas6/Cse3/CasE [Streptomyces aidingensis]SFD79821.1 CRISPR-associated protein Cas6/Cse3/CasE, subtype I-E/ECOLI [Streptomyces aidingensis]
MTAPHARRRAPTPGDPPALFHSHLILTATEQQASHDIRRLQQLLAGGLPALGRERAPAGGRMLFAAVRAPAVPGSDTAIAPAGPALAMVVRTGVRPDWSPLLDAGRLAAAEVRPVTPAPAAGQEVSLRITANPVIRDRRTHRHSPLRSRSECQAWLRRSLARHGVRVTGPVHVSPATRLTGTGRNGPVVLVIRDFQARATVTDSAALAGALAEGIGRGKAYGCGMLNLTPSAPRSW